MGNRVKRGLFQSSTGQLLNADVNGALNILRKVVGDSLTGITDSGCVNIQEGLCKLKIYKYLLIFDLKSKTLWSKLLLKPLGL